MKKLVLCLPLVAFVMMTSCEKKTEFVDKPLWEMEAKWRDHRELDNIRGNVKSHTTTRYSGAVNNNRTLSGGYASKTEERVYSETGYVAADNVYTIVPTKIETVTDKKNGLNYAVVRETGLVENSSEKILERDSRNRRLEMEIVTSTVDVRVKNGSVSDSLRTLNVNSYRIGDTIPFPVSNGTIVLDLSRNVVTSTSKVTFKYDDANRKATVTKVTTYPNSNLTNTTVSEWNLNEYYQIDEEGSYKQTTTSNTKSTVTDAYERVVERNATGNIVKESYFGKTNTTTPTYSYTVHSYTNY